MWRRLAICSVLAGFGLGGIGSAGLAEPAAQRADASWRSFVSEAGRFRIELPADPVVTPDEERFTLLGPVTGELYRVQLDDLVLAIEVRDLPRLAETLVPADRILESTRDGVLSDLDAVEIRRSDRSHQGLPARDFVYRIPEQPAAFERALAVLAGGRLYLLTGKAAGQPDASPEIRRFFASFRLWGEGQPGALGLPAAPADSP